MIVSVQGADTYQKCNLLVKIFIKYLLIIQFKEKD